MHVYYGSNPGLGEADRASLGAAVAIDVFDAERIDFIAGSVSRTVMHHVPVLLDVVANEACDIWVPRSYARWFFAHWRPLCS